MSERWTKEQVLNKVEWEGGLYEAITSYGISHTVLPEDTPPDVVEAWKVLEDSNQYADDIAEWLYSEDDDAA